MNKGLRGQVVIAFRSNSCCFWEIWAVTGSIPLPGTWFFSFVQIIFYKFFMYACISYNDKKESKLLCNLLKITLNFWTLWWMNPSGLHTNVKKSIRFLKQCFHDLHFMKTRSFHQTFPSLPELTSAEGPHFHKMKKTVSKMNGF